MEAVLVKSKGGWKAAARLEGAGHDLAALAASDTGIWKTAFRGVSTV